MSFTITSAPMRRQVMARTSLQDIATRLLRLLSPDTRLDELRLCKNEIIGHEEKKSLWVRGGLLKYLVNILSIPTGQAGSTPRRHQGRSEQEEARLQAIIVVGSIAQGGAPYISPLYSNGILPPLLDALSPNQASPITLLAALRTLNTIADARLLQHPLRRLHPDTLTDLLYTEQHLYSLAEILSQTSSSWTVQQQISLAASLISKTCQEDHHRSLLDQAGLYGILATKLASFVVATGCCPYASDGSRTNIPPPATEKAELAPVLEAVCAITETSNARWTHFLSNPVFDAVFSKSDLDSTSGYAARRTSSHPVESLIPNLQISHKSLPSTSSFPPLGAIGTSAQPSLKAFNFSIDSADGGSADESPLVPWLIFIARAEAGSVVRLIALQAATNLYKCGLAHKRREIEFATLLVPLLVNMLEPPSTNQKEPSASSQHGSRANRHFMEEKAPAVLASLVVDSCDLQRAAIDAGAIKRLSQILKQTFDPLPPSASAPLWQPDAESSEEVLEGVPRLGYQGLSPAASRITRLREATLTGLAAMASLRDEYRKSIIENGVISFVIQSLKPYNMDSPSKKDDRGSTSSTQIVTENTKDVVLAACASAQRLSRSVSTLRTSLMDAGLAPPLFILLKHQDVEIQIAATAVICNLVLDFSPMREAIVQGGILKILCEHAHSMNSQLLLNSIWALKHLVLNSVNSLKMECLNELGPGWLKQIISNGTEDKQSTRERESAANASMGMGTPNAVGMQVDLLNAVETDSNGSTQTEDDEGDVRMSDSEPESRQNRPNRTPNPPSSRAGSLLAIRPNPDDLAIQYQGLEFIRNLVCGQGATEMIDFLFSEFGQDRLFDLLRNKLSLRNPGGATHPNRRTPSTNSPNAIRRGRSSDQQSITELSIPVLYILIHIAAGLPRHRQILIAQTELLKKVGQLFKHEKREMRVCCAWLCINLTWVDNGSDEQNCKTRARELTKLGYLDKLRSMENDPELDVRERTKTAVHQMAGMIR